MGTTPNAHKATPLTEQEKQNWLDAIVMMDDTFLPALAWQGAGHEHKHVFVAAFDGTWNDRENLRPGEVMTNPALLEKELSALYDERLSGNYYNGVGTRENALMKVLNGMTGEGSEQRAEQAFRDFQKQSLEWLKEDPDAQIHVVTVGFSRGAASARHFLNLVDERGVPADAGRKLVEPSPYSESPFDTKAYQVYDKFAKQPGTVTSSALLYDTVATGQEQVLKLGIPASTRYVVHITSQDEDRPHFPLTAIHGARSDAANSVRFLTVSLPGVHSDIGGGYEKGVGKLGHYLGDQVLHRLGFDIEPGRVPTEALNEGRHRHGPGETSLQAAGSDEEYAGPGRRTRYVANESLTAAERAEMIAQNRVAEYDSGLRYVDELQKGTAPPDPLGYENLGVVLTPQTDGTVEVLLSNPSAIQFDERTGTISVYGHVARTLSEQDYADLKAGFPVVEVFSVAPEKSLAGHSPAKDVLTNATRTGDATKAPTQKLEEPAQLEASL